MKRFFSQLPKEVLGHNPYYNNAKRCEQKLAVFATQFDAEGHSIVFNEGQVKPIAGHTNGIAKHHVGFYPDFKRLVGQQYQYNNQQRFLQASLKLLLVLCFDTQGCMRNNA